MPSHPTRPRARARAASASLALAAAVLLGACGGPDWTVPHDGPLAEGTLGPGFVAPGETPTPEATVVPEAGSWDDVTPRPGYRVVLVSAGDDAPTRALVAAVRDWADAVDADLREIVADTSSELVPRLAESVGLGADLVVSAGNDLVDPLALVTASHLDQQFLVVGAEIAEPTANVTAVDWTGAAFRGEGLGASTPYDPATFTAERCATAVRAGVASVLGGMTGIVLWID